MTSSELLEFLTKEAVKFRENPNFISINKHLTGIDENNMPSKEQIDGVLVAFINYVGMSQYIDYALSYKDFEKKELKKIEQNMELTDFESALFTAFSDAWQPYLLGEIVNVKQWAKEHSKELLEAAKEELKEQKPTEWSEEDDEAINLACSILYSNFNENENFDKDQMCIGEIMEKLKSLKDRYTWKPSDLQIKALEYYTKIGCVDKEGFFGSELVKLLEELKKL